MGKIRKFSVRTTRKWDKLDKDRISQMYHDQGMSQDEIAEELGVTQYLISEAMKGFDIPRRVRAKRDQWGEKHHLWKGDKVSYRGAHARVQHRKGKANSCSVCGLNDSYRYYEWANLTGNYSDVDDYAMMCKPCHIKYDLERRNQLEHS